MSYGQLSKEDKDSKILPVYRLFTMMKTSDMKTVYLTNSLSAFEGAEKLASIAHFQARQNYRLRPHIKTAYIAKDWLRIEDFLNLYKPNRNNNYFIPFLTSEMLAAYYKLKSTIPTPECDRLECILSLQTHHSGLRIAVAKPVERI